MVVLVDSLDLEPATGASHLPTPVATAQPQHAIPETIPEPGDKYERYPGYENSHMTPSSTMTPSQALDAHEPLETSYLLALNPWYRGKAAAAAQDSSLAAKEMGLGVEELEAMEGKRIGMPCYYARMARIERNDLLAVCLVLMFVVVVVFVETFASAKRFWSKQGAIRLQDDGARETTQPLSVQADYTSVQREVKHQPEPSEKAPFEQAV